MGEESGYGESAFTILASSSQSQEGIRVSAGMKEESAHEFLRQFWPRMAAKVDGLTTQQLRVDANRSQELPLARIKKIMKLDETVQTQMISAEAPVLFAVASEMFIQELTLRAWCHVEDNKRKTLQKNDVAMAIARNEQFDFLIDIVPREEVKNRSLPPKPDPPPVPAQSMEGLQMVGLGAPQQVQVVGSSGSGDQLQYYIQMPSGGDNMSGLPYQLSNGQILQATQIGQPIPLSGSSDGGVQVITLPEGAQPIQLQLLPTNDPHGPLIAQEEPSAQDS